MPGNLSDLEKCQAKWSSDQIIRTFYFLIVLAFISAAYADSALHFLPLLQEDKNFDSFDTMTHLAAPYILGLKIAEQKGRKFVYFYCPLAYSL